MNAFRDKTVKETIKENYDHIFSAEKKVADFILNYPEKAVNANVSELANFSGVSDATVVRLCKHIGYQGYYQLRICLSRDIGRKQISSGAQKTPEDTVGTLFQKFASSMIAVGNNLKEEEMVECASLIRSSKQTHIVAVGNTSPLAQYAGFRLGRVGIRCTYNMVPEYFINHVNLAEPGDLVLALSKSGTSKQVVQALELAKERKLKTIVITGHEYSPVSRLADHVLLSGVEESALNFYKTFSHLAETAVVDALVSYVTNEDGIEENKAEKPEMIFSEYKI